MNERNLFLCRTPLQAKIMLSILDEGYIDNFDCLYFTQNDSDTDRNYFRKIKEKASNVFYFFLPPRKPDILNHLRSIWVVSKKWAFFDYDGIYLASFDSILFRYIIKKNPSAKLYGLDDGTANITRGGLYFNYDESNSRLKFYNKTLGLESVNSLKLKLCNHYSIYPSFDNVVSKDKIKFINPFSFGNDSDARKEKLVFFIGQPFHEYLDGASIHKIKSWVSSQAVDFYIMHPREDKPILSGVNILDTKGFLAEDAIFNVSLGRRPTIISAYSTVLFNIPSVYADKIYLSVGSSEVETQRRLLISKTGSEIIYLGKN